MLTTYIAIYGLLAVAGVIEIVSGIFSQSLGMGVRAFFLIFTIILVFQTFVLIRQRSANPELQQRTLYNTHRMSLVLGTIFVLLIGLFAL